MSKATTTRRTPAKKTAPRAPQDHRKPAAKREADGDQTVEITWRGHTFTVPADPDEWDVDITEAFETGKIATAIRGLLGEKQWAAWKREFKPKNKDLGDLFDALAEELGMEKAGN